MKRTILCLLIILIVPVLFLATPPQKEAIFDISYEINELQLGEPFEIIITITILKDVENANLKIWPRKGDDIKYDDFEYDETITGREGEKISYIVKGYVPKSIEKPGCVNVEIWTEEYNPLMFYVQNGTSIYLKPENFKCKKMFISKESFEKSFKEDNKIIEPTGATYNVGVNLELLIAYPKLNNEALSNVYVELVEQDTLGAYYIVDYGYTDSNGKIYLNGKAEDLIGNPELAIYIYAQIDPDEDGEREIIVETPMLKEYVFIRDIGEIDKDYYDNITYTIDPSNPEYYDNYVALLICSYANDYLYARDQNSFDLFLKDSLVKIRYPVGDFSNDDVASASFYTINIPYAPQQFQYLYNSIITSIFHEYGHCIDYHHKGKPTKTCFPSDHTEDMITCPSFALIEGWAEFYEYWLTYYGISRSNMNSGNVNDSTVPRYYDDWIGYKVEGTIAAFLWDIMDSDTETNLDFPNGPPIEEPTHSSVNAIRNFVYNVGGLLNDIRDPNLYGLFIDNGIPLDHIQSLFAYYGIDNVASYLHGTVYNFDGSYASNVEVEMEDIGNWHETTYTNDEGYFSFGYRPHGTVENVYVDGVSSNSFSIESQPIPGTNNQVNLEIYLPSVVISGKITDQNGEGIPYVKMNFDGDSTFSLNTNSEGEYSVELKYGWTGTITPQKDKWNFNPSSKSFTDTNPVTSDQTVNFVGTHEPVLIRGRVTDQNGDGVENAQITASGVGSVYTDSNGYYGIEVEYGWSGTLEVSKTDWTFPDNSQYFPSVTSNKVQDFTGHPNTIKVYGVIEDRSDSPISGVKVTASGEGETYTDYTDTNGHYEVNVDYDWSGSLTPSLTGWEFDPEFYNLENVINEELRTFEGSIIQFHISGTVLKEDGTPLSDVEIDFDNGEGSETTESDGTYDEPVDYGWSGSAFPEKEGWEFVPTHRTYNDVKDDDTNEDYTAIRLTYTISGYVKDGSGNGINGVVVTVTGTKEDGGAITKDDITDSLGYYEINEVDYGSNITIRPEKENWEFTPQYREETKVTENITQNFTGDHFDLTISGYVRDSRDNSLMSDVTITFDPGGVVTTDNNGFYSKGLDSGWTGTITATKDKWSFTGPISLTNVVNSLENQNFTGTHDPVIISGTILEKGNNFPIPDVAIEAGGNTVYTDSNGEYSIEIDYMSTGSLTASKDKWTFVPSSISFVDITTNQVQDFTGEHDPLTISGKIIDVADQTGIPNVAISVTNKGTIYTDSNGNYTVNVAYRWSGIVEPSLTKWTFSPLSKSFTNLTTSQELDFTGTHDPVTISGAVQTPEGNPIESVSIEFPDETINTDLNGEYSKLVPYKSSGTIIPNKLHYNFIPPNGTYNNILVDTRYNFTGMKTKMILQSPSDISRELYTNAEFLVWFSIYNIEGIKQFDLTVTTAEDFDFKDIYLVDPNHDAGTSWQEVTKVIDPKEIHIVYNLSSETLTENQSLGYIICKLEDGVNLVENTNLNANITFTNTAGYEVEGEVQILNNCTDFDINGIVDLSDIGIFSGKYGTQFGQVEFDPMADYDCDGEVDFDDLGYFVNYILMEYETNQ